MKNLNIFTLLLITGISMICVSCINLFPTVGNGNLITSEKTVSSFEKINISGSAEVRFHASQEYRTVITVDSNLIEYTEIITRGNTLNIGTKNGNYSFTKYLVDVYCPIVTGVSVSGSGLFTCNDTITTSTFDSNISGSGKFNYRDDPRINSRVRGSGQINNIEIKLQK